MCDFKCRNFNLPKFEDAVVAISPCFATIETCMTSSPLGIYCIFSPTKFTPNYSLDWAVSAQTAVYPYFIHRKRSFLLIHFINFFSKA